ncbi:MAG: hypothetical protein SCK28_04020 [Bacillota bacterium]|nr:hypothetical protein [Bacillota bacterium]
MKRKSKFITFMLSFIPGLGHLYLRLAMRGLIFFMATMGVFLLAILYTSTIGHDPLPLILLPVVWVVALVDSFIMADRINEQFESSDATLQNGVNRIVLDEAVLKTQNEKLIAVLLSAIPGAGHMYLGLQRQGLQLMTLFFFIIYFSDWLRISMFLFIVPIIWFYSVFDTLNKASGEEELEDKDMFFVSWIQGKEDWSIKRHKVLGYGLVFIGVVLILNQVALPVVTRFIGWEIGQYLQTGVIAILFILGGIKILLGQKTNLEQVGEEE